MRPLVGCVARAQPSPPSLTFFMSRRLPPVPRGALDAAPDDSTRAHQTLSELWIAALKTHRDQTGNDLAESDLVRSIVACGTTEAVLSIIDARTQQFKEFRKYGGKSKEALKRAVPLLRKFTDVTANATSVSITSSRSYVCTALIFRYVADCSWQRVRYRCDCSPPRGEPTLEIWEYITCFTLPLFPQRLP